MINIINGGVTAPQGFRAAGIESGLKNNGKKDLAVVVSDEIASSAGVFTKNIIKGHSLQLTMNNIKNEKAGGIVINSGNANACVGKVGEDDALEMCNIAAKTLGYKMEEILIGSTGVIGMPLNMDAIRKGIKLAGERLSYNKGNEAAEAIMTTDILKKEIALEFEIDGKKVRVGGMAKGSGMIHPNMATMIGIITTDVKIQSHLLQKILFNAVQRTFNRVSVDGDTSVCDMVICLANGMSKTSEIIADSDEYMVLQDAFMQVCEYLARLIAKDGEGATKLIEICVKGAIDQETAYKIAVSVAKSPLVKTAIFGEDANWGRIITAAGYSGAIFDPNTIDIYIGGIKVCSNGCALYFDEKLASSVLKEDEVMIIIDLQMGNASDRMWTCDFSYDYIKINGSYRS